MRKLRRAIAILLRMGFPWPGKRADPWSRVARRALLNRWPAPLRPLVWLLSALVWPVSSLILSLNNARAARMGPKGLWRLCWHAALTRNIPPREFVYFQLHLEGALEQPWRYETETATLLGQITHPETAHLARDKRAFHDWMRARGAPIVPRLATLGAHDVVTKPRDGGQGRNVIAWRREGEHWRAGQDVLSAQALEALVERNGLLLQPLIAPHPKLGSLVARIITCRTGPRAELIEALAQLPAEGDFISHRGPYRRIRLETGEIRRAGPGQRSLLYGGLRSEMPLEGQVLPGWAEIQTHLTTAHEALPPPCPLIGWDVIWGPDDPLILEANVGIAFTRVQLDTLAPVELPEGVL